MIIRQAQPDELAQVAAIEHVVEDPRVAASIQTLQERQHLFPQGFLVAVEDATVVGYLESIRWLGSPFERFEEIRDYTRMHQDSGPILYLAYLAVQPDYRRRGIGAQLVNAALNLGRTLGLEKVQLVSMPRLVPYYERLGFERVRRLPAYLENTSGELMEQKLAAG